MDPVSVIPYSPPYRVDSPVDMVLDDYCRPTTEAPHLLSQVYHIPDVVPDEILEELRRNTKSKLDKYCGTSTLNRAERTITFTRELSRWDPGPALNKNGVPELISYIVCFPENRAKKLKHVWPEVEEIFYEYGISCNLNSADCSMQVSTSPFLEDLCLLDRAKHLLELLSTSLVPPSMAFEIFRGIKQHNIIKIGDQQDGLCTQFDIKKEEYLKQWNCLFYSLKALSKASQCHIFLDENTFTAVTAGERAYERLSCLKSVVGNCITKNLCPATSIRKVGNLEDPHAKHMKMVESGPSLIKDSCSLYVQLHQKQVAKLRNALTMLESSLTNYGISCTLEKHSVAFTTTRCTNEPDIIDKAWQLLELLSTTHVPVSLAIEIMDGSMQSCLIKIGNQEGGISSGYGISEEEYHVQWECLRHSLQAVADTAECNVFLDYNNVAAVGSTSLELLKQLVVNCFLHNVCPGTVCADFDSVSRGRENIEDPHVKHMEMEKSKSSLHMLEVSSFYRCLTQQQATELSNKWSVVESCLQKHDISCKLVADEFYMTISLTREAGESNTCDNISDILTLLSADAPPLEAIQVLEGGMYYDFIQTGFQYGGFCFKYGLTKEQFEVLVWPRVALGLKEIGRDMECYVKARPNVIVVCGQNEDIDVFRGFVEHCFDLARRRVCEKRTYGRKSPELKS